MQKINKTVASQIISGILKFLAAAFLILLIFAVIIPFSLSIVKGKDIPPIDDSSLQLQTINIPEEENAFYDLTKLYNTEKHQELISLKSVPAGKDWVVGYLESDQWDQEVVEQILNDNEAALQHFSAAAAKGVFQLPDADAHAKISSDMPVTPLNAWREASRLSGVKAIWLAENGQDREALDEAFKSIIIGNAIENSQSLLITHLVGIAIKNNGLDILQKVLTIIPKDSVALLEYQFKLSDYKAKGNSSPFITEYLVAKQAWNNLEQDIDGQFRLAWKFLLNNKFYYKKNLSHSYYFDFYNKLAIEAEKDCSEVKEVQEPEILLEDTNLVKMYFTENAVGKYFLGLHSIALNNVLTKKCATEDKLNETSLIIVNKK